MTQAATDHDATATANGAEVRFQGVERHYGAVQALGTTDLTLEPGSFTALVGPSGCGKSTLLDIAAGLNRGYDGRVEINDQELKGPRRKTGIIFQEAAVLPWRTVLDNAAFALETEGVPKAKRREVARDVLSRVGLSKFADHYPGQLSGGMRQRCAISRVLSTDPDLILADEPFGALDEQTRVMMGVELLKMVEQSGATVLFVTHSIQEAVMLSDRVLVMSARPGRVLLDVEVDLPAERDPSVMALPRAGQLTDQIWETLQPEAAQAMADRAVR